MQKFVSASNGESFRRMNAIQKTKKMDTLEEEDSDDDKIVQEKSSKTKRFD